MNDKYFKYKINKITATGRLSLFIYVHYGNYDYINMRYYPKILKDENNNEYVVCYVNPKSEQYADSIYIEAKN